jgi:predicted permease
MNPLRPLFRRSQVEREMDAELRFHLEELARGFERQGESREEALRRARLEFGGIEQVKDDAREARMTGMLDRWRRELRAAARSLAKSPGFAVVAVTTLALGIGVNTEIFSLLDQAALRSLPVREPDRLVAFHSLGVNPGMDRNSDLKLSFSYPKYKEFRDGASVFEGVAGRFAAAGSVLYNGATDRAGVELVTGNYFDVLGVAPAAGRLIGPSDDQTPMGHPVVALGYGYWQRRFGGDPGVIGQKLVVNGVPMTIIGVSAKGFQGLVRGSDDDIRVPMMMKDVFTPTWPNAWERRNMHWMNVVARLKSGMPPVQAEAAANVLYRQILAREAETLNGPYLSQRDEYRKRHLDLQPAGRGLLYTVQNGTTFLMPLWAMTGIVLLIACVNVASLVMARTASRQRELAIRLALGAGRLGVARQLLTENLLLVFAGGGLGVLLASAIGDQTTRLLYSPTADQIFHAMPDLRVMAFALAATAVSALLFSLAPLWQIRHTALGEVLRAESGASSKAAQVRFRKALVVVQLSFCVWLTIAAGLFAETLSKLRAVDLGFRKENLIQFALDPTMSGYKGAAATAICDKVEVALGAVPGVTNVGRSAYGVMGGGININRIEIEGFQPAKAEDTDVFQLDTSPGYLKAMGIQLLTGRGFVDSDFIAGSTALAHVAMVNESFARRYFGGQNPIGRHIRSPFNKAEDQEIVGMIRDQHYFGPRDEPRPFYYLPRAFPGSATYYVRTAAAPESLLATVRRVVEREAPGVPISRFRTMEEQTDLTLGSEKQFATLATIFGLLAMVLAAIGLYGVMSYTVARRTREIGIRMAIGAGRREVLGMVLREAVVLIGIGLLVGIPTAIAMARLVRSQFYQVSAADPVVMAGAAVVVLAVGLVAGFVPARRATTVDPIRALRWD